MFFKRANREVFVVSWVEAGVFLEQISVLEPVKINQIVRVPQKVSRSRNRFEGDGARNVADSWKFFLHFLKHYMKLTGFQLSILTESGYLADCLNFQLDNFHLMIIFDLTVYNSSIISKFLSLKKTKRQCPKRCRFLENFIGVKK